MTNTSLKRSNQTLIALNTLALIALIAFFMSSWKGERAESGAPAQRVRSISLDKPFTFCGEAFPMDNWDVRQRMDAELLRNVYYHSHALLAIKRANALFPIIEPILKEEGAPDDLKYLAVAESNLSNAVSPAGARGVWQFMKSAAADFGLEVNTEVDERYHLEKATRAACRYMINEQKRLGSWIAAAAAYNGGPGRIHEEMRKQRAKTFFDLNLAADETMRYPFRIAAIKELMENPDEYEYFIEPDHLYPPLKRYKTVKVSGPVESWADFAAQFNMSYRMFKLYNPWLIDSKLTNKAGKTYEIKVVE